MREVFSKKKGFTLIELLIVIGIIAMMGVLAIGGYVQYRKNAVLDLAADNLVSFFGEARSNTVYGVESGERHSFILEMIENEDFFDEEEGEPFADAKCFGVEFERDGDDYFLYTLSYDFDGRRVWNGEKWVYRGCSDIPERRRLQVLDRNVEIESVYLDGISPENIALRFVPPEGIMELSDNGDFEVDFENEELIIKINFLGSERDYRNIKFDLITEYVSKIDRQ